MQTDPTGLKSDPHSANNIGRTVGRAFDELNGHRKSINDSRVTTRLDALSRRADDIRAALKAIQAKQRAQERADDRRIKALIGAALVADIEAADAASLGARKAYISEVLDRHAPAMWKPFLTAKGWL